jgi:glycosyltransferase involved in cell wall biosynthesis
VRVVVTSDRRYCADAGGRVWTASIFDRAFFQRYLTEFDEVRVVARVGRAEAPVEGWRRVDGHGVTVHALPYFVGPLGFARRSPQALMAAAKAFSPGDAVILRGGSPSVCLEPFLALRRHPYGLEVVGDPFDVFAPGSVQHRLAGLARWWSCFELRRRASDACAVAYVTECHLQRRYPPNPNAFTTCYSSADLTEAAYAAGPRRPEAHTGPFRLVAVGSMEQRYKGYDVLIEAVRECVAAGSDLTLTLVGDGKHRPELESQAAGLSVSSRATFTGELAGAEVVRQVLADSDLFVHPSRAEGLPRVVIEAMAQALPCVASTAGGTSELLPAEDMVAPGDATELAEKIRAVLKDPARMARMSGRNLIKARQYHRLVLQARRDAFFRHVRHCTEERASGARSMGHATRLLETQSPARHSGSEARSPQRPAPRQGIAAASAHWKLDSVNSARGGA